MHLPRGSPSQVVRAPFRSLELIPLLFPKYSKLTSLAVSAGRLLYGQNFNMQPTGGDCQYATDAFCRRRPTTARTPACPDHGVSSVSQQLCVRFCKPSGSVLLGPPDPHIAKLAWDSNSPQKLLRRWTALLAFCHVILISNVITILHSEKSSRA